MKDVSLERDKIGGLTIGDRSMRKLFKHISIAAAAAVLGVSSAVFAGCGYTFTLLAEMPAADAAVSSQGGFVVEKGEYLYFINGVESHTAENTYGTPVKGALMRIKTADVKAGSNTAEIVVPSLMVAADYTSGIYIYGDRVYYATPNTVGNTVGEVDSSVLSFRSAKLNGTDVREHFRMTDNAATYRFASVSDTVYILYENDGTLGSYNTSSGKNTTLAEDVVEFVLNSTEKGDPYVYYTMGVSAAADSDSPLAQSNYNQIYRVRADATEARYEYEWDRDYLDEHDGEAPYHNYGELVLDGIADTNDVLSNYNHDAVADEGGKAENTLAETGFTYTLQAYTNGGIYFTRTDGTGDGALYYLSAEKIGAEGWNSVTGNCVYAPDVAADKDPEKNETGALEMVARATDTAHASTAALFYLEEDAADNIKHHYLYVDGEIVYRTDVVNDGEGTKKPIGKGGQDSLEIARDASGATLVSLQTPSEGQPYGYVYYTKTNGGGMSVERAVYNGIAENYLMQDYLEGNEAYKQVKLLNIEHVSSWYNYEVVDGIVFYVNAHAFGEESYQYVWAADITNADGTLMDNTEIEALNEKYEAIVGEDEGYIAKLSEEGNGKLSGMVEYYFYTGLRTAVDENIAESVENGKSETYLYSEEEKKSFGDFVKGEGDAAAYQDENGKFYTTLSYFTQMIGKESTADEEAQAEYWRNVLQRYTVDEETAGLPAWAWALIGVAIGLAVVGGAVTAVLVVRHKRKQAGGAPREERMAVDTTDDKNVDVYAVNGSAEENGGDTENAEETPAEGAEDTAEAEPAENAEDAAEAEEAPAEPSASPAEEAPSKEE